jgi:hypothetical protein
VRRLLGAPIHRRHRRTRLQAIRRRLRSGLHALRPGSLRSEGKPAAAGECDVRVAAQGGAAVAPLAVQHAEAEAAGALRAGCRALDGEPVAREERSSRERGEPVRAAAAEGSLPPVRLHHAAHGVLVGQGDRLHLRPGARRPDVAGHSLQRRWRALELVLAAVHRQHETPVCPTQAHPRTGARADGEVRPHAELHGVGVKPSAARRRAAHGGHVQHPGERVAVAGAEAAAGEVRRLEDLRVEHPEHAAVQRLVPARVEESRAVHEHRGLRGIPAADVEVASLRGPRNARRRLEGVHHVRRAARGGEHVHAAERGGAPRVVQAVSARHHQRRQHECPGGDVRYPGGRGPAEPLRETRIIRKPLGPARPQALGLRGAPRPPVEVAQEEVRQRVVGPGLTFMAGDEKFEVADRLGRAAEELGRVVVVHREGEARLPVRGIDLQRLLQERVRLCDQRSRGHHSRERHLAACPHRREPHPGLHRAGLLPQPFPQHGRRTLRRRARSRLVPPFGGGDARLHGRARVGPPLRRERLRTGVGRRPCDRRAGRHPHPCLHRRSPVE